MTQALGASIGGRPVPGVMEVLATCDTIESEAARIANTNFIRVSANEPFAIRDGRLIIGPQQDCSCIAAEVVLDALGESRNQ